jgi:hypothetical protein
VTHTFAAAAERHLGDAKYLREDSRLANADHLAGLSVECALKAILIDFLGARPTEGKPQSELNGKRIPHGHLPELWKQVEQVLHGRNHPQFHRLVTSATPTESFQKWSVFDRYSGTPCDAAAVDKHLLIAHLVYGAWQLANQIGELE